MSTVLKPFEWVALLAATAILDITNVHSIHGILTTPEIELHASRAYSYVL